MEKILCLNFCELLSYFIDEDVSVEYTASRIKELLDGRSCQRVYFGSTFCSQYFLNLSGNLVKRLMEVCEYAHIKVTMVVPTFSEKDLQDGKRKIALFACYFQNYIDEVTVNDYGMLQFMKRTYQIPLNLGRLFMKDYRDPRYPEYFNQRIHPKIFHGQSKALVGEYQVVGMEFDPTHAGIDFSEAFSQIEVGVHTPLCYLTEGHICGYASIFRPREEKFRPNVSCGAECQQYIIEYQTEEDGLWYRIGRSIFFRNSEVEITGIEKIRTIYFPIDKVVSL